MVSTQSDLVDHAHPCFTSHWPKRGPKPMLQNNHKTYSRATWYGIGQVGRAVLSVGGWCGQLAPSLIYWSPPVRCRRHTTRQSAGRFHSLNLHRNWSILHQHQAMPRAASMIYPHTNTQLLRLTTHHYGLPRRTKTKVKQPMKHLGIERVASSSHAN